MFAFAYAPSHLSTNLILLVQLGHTTSDNVTTNDAALRELSKLLKKKEIVWDPKEHRIRSVKFFICRL